MALAKTVEQRSLYNFQRKQDTDQIQTSASICVKMPTFLKRSRKYTKTLKQPSLGGKISDMANFCSYNYALLCFLYFLQSGNI